MAKIRGCDHEFFYDWDIHSKFATYRHVHSSLSSRSNMPESYHQENSSFDSLTQIDINHMPRASNDRATAPHHISTGDQCAPQQDSAPSGLGIPRASSVLLRPDVSRRTSAITWQETHETNSIFVPTLLKKEVATSKAGRIKPVVEKFASWFKGSPEDLEEIEEAREDDRKWKRKVRKWKRERRLSEERGMDGVIEKYDLRKADSLRRKLLCA